MCKSEGARKTFCTHPKGYLGSDRFTQQKRTTTVRLSRHFHVVKTVTSFSYRVVKIHPIGSELATVLTECTDGVPTWGAKVISSDPLVTRQPGRTSKSKEAPQHFGYAAEDHHLAYVAPQSRSRADLVIGLLQSPQAGFGGFGTARSDAMKPQPSPVLAQCGVTALWLRRASNARHGPVLEIGGGLVGRSNGRLPTFVWSTSSPPSQPLRLSLDPGRSEVKPSRVVTALLPREFCHSIIHAGGPFDSTGGDGTSGDTHYVVRPVPGAPFLLPLFSLGSFTFVGRTFAGQHSQSLINVAVRIPIRFSRKGCALFVYLPFFRDPFYTRPPF